jgi:hypothetical protein
MGRLHVMHGGICFLADLDCPIYFPLCNSLLPPHQIEIRELLIQMMKLHRSARLLFLFLTRPLVKAISAISNPPVNGMLRDPSGLTNHLYHLALLDLELLLWAWSPLFGYFIYNSCLIICVFMAWPSVFYLGCFALDSRTLLS